MFLKGYMRTNMAVARNLYIESLIAIY